jgi:hypothetical protein
MNISQIENNIKSVYQNFNKDTFIYDFLLAYDIPKASIKKLKDGGTNLSKNEGEILWKKKLFFKISNDGSDLHGLIDDIKGQERITKHSIRFIIVTDFVTFLSIDTKTLETLDIPFQDVTKYFDFFLPLAGIEKNQQIFENHADVKAAERMGKLYDEIKKDNATGTEEEIHSLNVFLTRLLFCFFAEDTNIFEEKHFTNSISSHTQADGSDLSEYLERTFNVMNTPKDERGDIPAYLNSFPYVNGGLFRDKHQIPSFSRKSRQIIIESGELDWSAINPDIFGSMIQAVITPEHRGGLGMHYTSVPNIMKVIEPLFLDNFYEELEASKGNTKKLHQLLNKLSNTKYFDPACGSGNFLIIAYKELRKLEMKIFKELNEMAFSNISLNQFYGIELDDFAHEVAILSLWLAEHQMNQVFFKEFGRRKPALPLTSAGNIIQGNACRLDWDHFCSKSDDEHVYILGNPPFLGQKKQSKSQKEDMLNIFKEFNTNYKTLDYISCWFIKASKYINENSSFAFVTTNSLTQGSHISLLWPLIFKDDTNEIFFAHKDFAWSNNAKKSAAVFCSIIGIRTKNKSPKFIYDANIRTLVTNISPYLSNETNVIVEKRAKTLSQIPKMVSGNMALDGGFLLLSDVEKDEMIQNNHQSKKFIKETTGGYEFINGMTRWCLWIEDEDLKEAYEIPEIKQRIEGCKKFRLNGGDVAKTLAFRPHQFRYRHTPQKSQIIIPLTSSIRREYIPIGFIEKNIVIQQSAQAIYDSELFVFAIITSKMHMIWVRAVAGKLKMDYSYSVSICYNTFPFPVINEVQKNILEKCVYNLLEVRENNSEKTLAQLYDPDKMPDNLREVHHQLDIAIERCYRSKPFENDEERLEYLFKLYEQMIEEEKTTGTLFEVETKPKKKKK